MFVYNSNENEILAAATARAVMDVSNHTKTTALAAAFGSNIWIAFFPRNPVVSAQRSAALLNAADRQTAKWRLLSTPRMVDQLPQLQEAQDGAERARSLQHAMSVALNFSCQTN